MITTLAVVALKVLATAILGYIGLIYSEDPSYWWTGLCIAIVLLVAIWF